MTDADSTECDPETPHKVIYKLRDLLGIEELGGTMRLGQYPCELTPGSLAHQIYGTTHISERHRHRYEFNCLYEQALTERGLQISGKSPDGKFVEIAELPGHPWYVAVQFHPEFKSKPWHRIRCLPVSWAPLIATRGHHGPDAGRRGRGVRAPCMIVGCRLSASGR